MKHFCQIASQPVMLRRHWICVIQPALMKLLHADRPPREARGSSSSSSSPTGRMRRRVARSRRCTSTYALRSCQRLSQGSLAVSPRREPSPQPPELGASASDASAGAPQPQHPTQHRTCSSAACDGLGGTRRPAAPRKVMAPGRPIQPRASVLSALPCSSVWTSQRPKKVSEC